jgi:dTDP-4-amino-4,6-dideoxygalactose transaminase
VVPVVDLTRRGRASSAAFAAAARRVAESGTFLLGAETAAFEAEFGAWLLDPTGAGLDAVRERSPRQHVVSVASGASALQLALAAAGVGQGDEVIVPAFTAVPTASAVCALGAVPVPVDVLPDSANLDPALLAAARTARTKAVIVVHLYGRPADVPALDLPVIEDAAQAHGAVDPRSPSVAVAYSFYPTKNLGGIGDGGAVVTSDEQLADAVRQLRVHGMSALYVHDEISQNFRMSEIEAAWLRHALGALTEHNERRRHIAALYREAAPQLRWQVDHPQHVHHLCVFRSADRDETRAQLAEADVGTAVHYPLAITQQPAYLRYNRADCSNAESWAAQCVTVPCFPELTDGEVQHVAGALAALRPADSRTVAR